MLEQFLPNLDKYLVLFPFLVPNFRHTLHGSLLTLNGFLVTVNEQLFEICIIWQTWLSFKTLEFTVDKNLAQLTANNQEEILSLLEEASSFEQFLCDFKAFVDRLCTSAQNLQFQGHASGIRNILESLEKIDSKRVEFSGDNFKEVILKALDSRQREHVLKVSLSENGIGSVKPQLPLKMDMFSHLSVLSEHPIDKLYLCFCKQLSKFEAFWDEMDDVDETCWVVEPQPPVTDRSICFRRIVLSPYSSIQIKIDPLNPRSLPACNIIGPDEERRKLTDNINRRVFMWNLEHSLVENLATILNLDEMPRTKSFEQKIANECQICFNQQLNVEIPDVVDGSEPESVIVFPDMVCPNERCCRLFHKDCLLEWFRSLPNTRQSFKTWTGECPFCSMLITLQIGTDTAMW